MQTIRPRKLFRMLVAAWLAILAFFWLFPAIDIGFSKAFFSAAACPAGSPATWCGSFTLGSYAFMQFLRDILFYLPTVIALFLLLSLWLPGIDRIFRWPEGCRHNRILLLGVWLADTGVFVNMLLKAFSGRPRPADTLLFGGSLPFVPAGDLTGACTSNCSFISGEAASAGWLFCLLALLPPAMRERYFYPVLAVSALTAFMRVGFGRHFVSDAVLAWMSALVFFALFATLFGWKTAGNKGSYRPVRK